MNFWTVLLIKIFIKSKYKYIYAKRFHSPLTQPRQPSLKTTVHKLIHDIKINSKNVYLNLRHFKPIAQKCTNNPKYCHKNNKI
jgi:hypothetical protein